MLKKLLLGILGLTIILSSYVVWLKQGTNCTSCMSTVIGLHLSQFTLSIFALIGALLISFTYFMANRVESLIYVNLSIALVSAISASYLMAVQLRTKYLCIPCFTLDVLFYLIFVLLCVYYFKNKGETRYV